MLIRRERKSLGVYITHWTDRKPFKEFERTLEDDRWNSVNAELNICYNGSRSFEGETRNLKCAIDVDGTGKLTETILTAFQHALHMTNYKYVAVLDDDAYIKDLPETIARINRAMSLTLNDRPTGCSGPIDSYIQWTRHNYQSLQDEPGIFDLNRYPWFTAGMQVYSRAYIEKCMSDLKYLLQRLVWRSDYPLFMYAHLQGFGCTSVSCKYDHVNMSTMDDWKVSESWYVNRIGHMLKDRRTMIDFFNEREGGDKFVPQIEKLCANDIVWLRKKLIKHFGTDVDKDWTVKLYRHIRDLLADCPD